MKHTIRGTTLPILDVQLEEGESMYTESGGMAWMSTNIEMETNTRGGFMKGLARALSGESLFMTNYKCTKGTGVVSFCTEMPGQIVPMKLSSGKEIICQRDAFMAGTEGTDIKMEFVKKLGAGFFGGEGFFLQRLSGEGTIYLELSGEITEYDLKKGQTLRVDPGYIGAFEPTINYDIERVKGFKNMLFGGEGLFHATITGPGKVWLQSMPLANLAKKIAKYIPQKNSGGSGRRAGFNLDLGGI